MWTSRLNARTLPFLPARAGEAKDHKVPCRASVESRIFSDITGGSAERTPLGTGEPLVIASDRREKPSQEIRKEAPNLTVAVNLVSLKESSVAADRVTGSSERSPLWFSGDEVSR